MRGNTHAAGGALAGTAMAIGMELPVPGVIIAAMLGSVGGLLPDIDHPNSKITHKLGILGQGISHMFRHRGALHTPLFWLLFNALVAIVLDYFHAPSPWFWTMSLLVGEFSHLVLDSLNPTGIMWFWPITKKRQHLLKIRTGSGLDTATGVLCAITCACLILRETLI